MAVTRKTLALLIAGFAFVALGSGMAFPLGQRVWRLWLAGAEEITIDGNRYVLEPNCYHAWGGIPPGNRDPHDGFAGGLSCYLSLRVVGLGFARPDLRADSVWFTLGPLAYGTTVRADSSSAFHDLPDRRIWIAGKGPRWLEPLPFTVVLRVYDGRGRTYVIRRSGVTLETVG